MFTNAKVEDRVFDYLHQRWGTAESIATSFCGLKVKFNHNDIINGKFWFGLQSSEAADRFGGTKYDPIYIDYYFGKDDLPDVKKL